MKRLLALAIEVSQEMHTLKAYIQWESRRFSERVSEEWIDSERVKSVLNIKKRALQNLRDEGLLPSSLVRGKLFYKVTDVEALLKSNYLTKKKRAHGTE